MLVDSDVQELHLTRVLGAFEKGAARTKNRSKLRPSLEDWDMNVNLCCIFLFHMKQVKAESAVGPEFCQKKLQQFLEGSCKHALTVLIACCCNYSRSVSVGFL